MIDPGSTFYLKRGKNNIVCRLSPIEENEILIKLDLVSTVNSMFYFPGAVIYSKVVRSNSLSLTFDDITNGIRAFIDTKLPFDIQEEIIKIITFIPYQYSYDPVMQHRITNFIGKLTVYNNSFTKKETIHLMEPLVRDTSKWGLDKHQEAFMKSICLFDICAKIGKTVFNVKDLLLNDHVKEHNILKYYDKYSFEIHPNEILSNWRCWSEKIEHRNILREASRYAIDAIRNSNINSKPRILPVQNSTSSPSIFLKSKPDSIISIDISIESTLLSFSFLDENGFVKKIWDHGYFVTDARFIAFAEDYLISDISSFSDFRNAECNNDIEI
ncbi:hypothetical protein EDC94DRAFT_659080 [Helicostylum pulchrum]|nr:hypothetical protein EDC94DRAFT_659080 [Helicostylum pulchrum]